jgi:broad specificity phosphatase PhoE
MKKVYFITHPDVIVDLSVPVEKWDLSALGLEKLRRMFRQPWLCNIGEIYSSKETKAVTAAKMLADHRGSKNKEINELGEMDRSATGPLPPKQFEQTVKKFFLNPEKSICGWEKAVDAQKRIVSAVYGIIKNSKTQKDIVVISHGGVGTMLLCHLKNIPISQSEDQPSQGHYFVFEAVSRALIHGWQPIDK